MTYSHTTVMLLVRDFLKQFLPQRSLPRGATPLADASGQNPRRHLIVLGVAMLGVGLIALSISSPQEAANLPADISMIESPDLDEALTTVSTDAPVPAVADVVEPEPQWVEEIVRNGDNLSLIFARAGFNDRDVYEVTRADGGRALRKIYPGETIAFLTDNDGQLSAVRHVESRLKWTTFKRDEQGYRTDITLREPEVREKSVTMRIDSSLFLAGQSAGLSGRLIMDLASIFGGVIDFVLDPRAGDTIEMVYQENYLDGEKLSDGEIIAAAFTNRGDTYEAYRYTDSAGDTSYYNEQGVSMRKAFMKAPVDFTRISSNFNPNRLHPIYKTKRPHRGTDYAAPTGTPVYASGDGRVVQAGYTRANGNYVFIQHGESFKTHYLHLNKRRVKTGQRVKQGEVIGTVGSTGAATGPHLHYEFLVNGVHRNPRTVHKQLPKAKSLPQTELARFQSEIHQPLQQLASLRQTRKLAMVNTDSTSGGQ